MLSAPLPYSVGLELLTPCRGEACEGAEFTTLLSKTFLFEQSGWVELLNSPTRILWPTVQPNANQSQNVRLFEEALWLSHSLQTQVGLACRPAIFPQFAACEHPAQLLALQTCGVAIIVSVAF